MPEVCDTRFLTLDVVDEDTVKHHETCDGCGREYTIGEERIWTIKSCCGGGCSRNLCLDCITWCYKKLHGED